MKKSLAPLVMLCFITFFAYPSPASADEVTVSAAISLKNAFEEIGRLYEASHPATKVIFNFGASGDLARQIAGGAPVDVFASAAQKDMDDMSAKGLILPGTRADFVKNAMVLVTPRNAGVATFEALVSERIKHVAVGNPKTVPAGRYAAEVFEYYRLTSAIKDKLVYSENVRQVLDYVVRGEVEAGVVYATDAAVRGAEVSVAAEAPESSHKPILYPIAVVRGTKNATAAKAFIEAVRSKEGMMILKKYGFRIQ